MPQHRSLRIFYFEGSTGGAERIGPLFIYLERGETFALYLSLCGKVGDVIRAQRSAALIFYQGHLNLSDL